MKPNAKKIIKHHIFRVFSVYNYIERYIGACDYENMQFRKLVTDIRIEKNNCILYEYLPEKNKVTC